MKMALFGATGRVGRYILEQALNEGHSVTALVRSPEKLEARVGLTLIKGNVLLEEDIEQTISGMDVVMSALGTDSTTTLSKTIPYIIDTMKREGINRIVTIGTAGILKSRIEEGKMRYQEKDSFRGSTFDVEEHHKVYDLLNKSGLDWTIVCPPYLPDGDTRGNYRVKKDYLPVDGKQITVGDTADFAFEELVECDYVGSCVGIAY